MLTDPVQCNSNSYEYIALVLSQIGLGNGIVRYGGTVRSWTINCLL